MKKSTSILTDPYIYVENKVLSPYWCKKVINKFNKDTRSYQGPIASGLDTSVKNSKDLNISDVGGWEKEDKYLHNKLTPFIYRYYDHLHNTIKFNYFVDHEYIPRPPTNIIDIGYQVQRTEPSKGYTWHNDFSIDKIKDVQSTRILTFIFYLNTVEEGWTQFYNGNQVAPQTGSACIFPATWTYVHQGYPPKQTKYIITGWIYIHGLWRE